MGTDLFPGKAQTRGHEVTLLKDLDSRSLIVVLAIFRAVQIIIKDQ